MKILSYTIKELLNKTTRKSVRHRKGCWPSKYRFIEKLDPTTKEPKDARWFFIVRCGDEDSDPKGHRVRVSLEYPERVPDNITDQEIYNSHVKVTCDCKAFLYYGARYNAQEKDYLDPHPNQRGKVVAPLPSKKRNLICKHLAVALPFAIKFIRNYYKSKKGEKVNFI
jgi:hypothetical protein